MPHSNFILAANHQSYLDIVACSYICVPRIFTFIGQVDKGRGLPGAVREFFYFLGGVIRLDRRNNESKRIASAEAVEALKRGMSLVIYPEGTRSKTGEIQEGKWGVAKIFLKTGVPVLPVAINGAFEVFPPGGKMKLRRIIRVNIGQPLIFREELERSRWLDADSEEYKNLCISITSRIMGEIKKLAYE